MDNSAAAPRAGSGAKNFFLYFLNFILLYIVSVSLGGVLFQIINKSVAQVGEMYYASSGALRFSLSALIIGTPIFLWLARKVYREAKSDESMRHSGIRRWLTYITLIAAALIVIGDLIGLVNSLLGGETTLRFVLKMLVVLVIAASVFYYYLNDAKSLRGLAEHMKPSMDILSRWYFRVIAVVCVAVIVSGFFFIESPVVQRLRQQDNLRISNLQNITYAIETYASQNKNALPQNLSQVALQEGTASDPVTNQPYTYTIVDPTTYRLCATFETSNKERDTREYGYWGPEWLHDAGETCFTRTIDHLLPKEIPAQLR